LGAVVVERETLLVLLFFLSPVCAFALTGLSVSLAPDFGAAPDEVAWVTGLASGLSSAAGSFAGGFVCDRMNRLSAYGICGFCAAASSAYLGFARLTPVAYAVGFLGYAVANGFGYAAFTALLLDTVSLRKHGIATTYSLMNASGSLATVYMTALDGIGYKHGGVRGLMGVESAANAISATLLLMIAAAVRKRARENRKAAAASR
jgi:MFS family permease